MCGIAGFVGEGSRGDAERMIARLRHRGPDDAGVLCWPGGALAHARLSIIDLSPTGAQPMVSMSGDVVIVFNGEIYNYRKLRADLESLGRTFRGTSDTEVVLYLYELYGVAAFAMLEGMFAIALFDRRDDSCVLARDRFGEKPLFWSAQGGTLFFASELKALLAHAAYRGAVDPISVQKFLFSEYVPAPASILRDTHKLEPASWLRWKDGKTTHGTYWQPSYQDTAIDESDAISQFGSLFEQATKRMLVSSDVPVGILLSGGLDSSTVAFYAQRASEKPIDTFSVAFEHPEFDESIYARAVANSIGSRHHEIFVTERNLLDIIPDIAEIADEPLADPSLIPTACLSKFVRNHVKVALGGDGADELLAGYETFKAERIAEKLAFLPGRLWKIIEPIVKLLPAGYGYMSTDYVAKRFVQGMTMQSAVRNPYWLASFIPEEQSLLLRSPMQKGKLASTIMSDAARHSDMISGAHSVNRLIHLYMCTYLADDILAKVDRAGMHAGLEVRAPFLDKQVVEFVNSLPTNLKRRGGTGKWILRELMKDKLPTGITERKKHGFALPLAAWLRGPLRDMSYDLLLSGSLCGAGMVNAEYVSRLLREHVQGRHNNYKQIWTLITLELWLKRWKSELHLA